jgi:hypothetical protein
LEGRKNCNVKKRKPTEDDDDRRKKKRLRIQQCHWPEKKKKKIFRPTHNPILLNIENNNPFLGFSSVL